MDKLAEVLQRTKFISHLKSGNIKAKSPRFALSPAEYKTALTAGLSTFAVHVQSRIASLNGEGFYTIGPCGEELIGGVGLALKSTDLTALHYRHLATQVVRQLKNGEPLDEILLNRARAHVCSKFDPVTGGNHCSLGPNETDFIVTSTLASQCPPAVGRALGLSLLNHLDVKGKFEKDAISYVSLGDGSVNNGHFLSARNLAEYSSHRKFECPVLFGISDNDKCISLPGHKYLTKSFIDSFNMRVFTCDGADLSDVTHTSKEATSFVRDEKKPAAIIYKNLPRRFGHAATDRQFAYMTEGQIEREMERNPLELACGQAVEAGAVSYKELSEEFEWIMNQTEKSFAAASLEEKASTNPVSVPLVPYLHKSPPKSYTERQKKTPIKEAMRKHMTRFYDEILSTYDQAVYIGEDVAHGGYYLVTDGLKKIHKGKVADFPPDETTLIGTAMGYSQVGLLPIVEIPYAKYLDCGADMFFEACTSTWLSKGQKPNGMIIRLQGFDRGVFGGNFHTHNSLYLPPGVDVVCFSNGEDYVKGMRYAVQQALAGRIVMTVDSTALLNLRGDRLQEYPETGHYDFDTVHVHESKTSKKAVVTYGNGVVEAFKAREDGADFTIIDCPLLSAVPKSLDLSQYEEVIFFDNCKEGQNPLAGLLWKMQSHCPERLPANGRWRCIAAPNTYNPLGQLSTFITKSELMDV